MSDTAFSISAETSKIDSNALSNKAISPVSRKNESRRIAWFHQYILSIVQKDMKDFGDLEYLKIAPRLIQIICQHSGNLIN